MPPPRVSTRLEEEFKDRLHIRTLDDVFVKTNSSINGPIMFDGEYESLKQIIATKTIRVPKPFAVVHNIDQSSAIAMEYLDISPLTGECASKLGRSLANLHDYNNKVLKFNTRAAKWIGGKPPSVKHLLDKSSSKRDEEEEEDADKSSEDDDEIQFSKHSMRIKNDTTTTKDAAKTKLETDQEQFADRFVPEPDTHAIERFGFDVPTSCGSIPQVNEWTSEWVPFYARHRLDKAIRSLLSVHSDRELSEQWSHLQLKVDKYFSDYKADGGETTITPALLHGDLWSGNAAQFSDGSDGVVYDPSSFYGHSEYEFGIVRMFGGFPAEFERAYFEVMPKRKFFEKRNKLYQLFHHLNHWDHFGSGYRSSSLRLVKDLNAAV